MATLTKEEKQRQRVLHQERQFPTQQISNRFQGLKVLGAVADTSACGYYRIMNPLQLLKLHGAKVHYTSRPTVAMFMDYDIILAPRQHSPEVYEVMRMIQWESKTLIYELDDDLDAVLPSSPAYFTYFPGSPESFMIPKYIKHCHGMTTTTEDLEKMKKL